MGGGFRAGFGSVARMKLNFDAEKIPSPCYVVDENLLEKNLKLLRQVADESGCKILLAQKAFSMYETYPLIAKFLDGTTASGLHEAMLSDEYFKKENHVFSAAYTRDEFEKILPLCSHIVFNSFSQLHEARNFFRAQKNNSHAGRDADFEDLSRRETQRHENKLPREENIRFEENFLHKKNFGIRINPEISTQGGGIYDPCAVGSRLGVTLKNFRFEEFDDGFLNGIHFHTLCQQNSDALEETLCIVEKKFSTCFEKLSWINFGGGHHITRADYDVEKLIALIKNFKKKYDLEVYLEPGEAVALDAGFFVCTVSDIIENGGNIAILDASAACHMPDVLEMPYRPRLIGAVENGAFSYKLGAPTCLAGDFIGEYSFDAPLRIGDKLIFEDMAIYSMVKNNTFNGINLPAIAKRTKSGEIKILRQFGYDDFKARL
ncbi:MAG: carboxynorspermidine decarboxylase [Defluviitaleaceae bacterium]|nr:carboxynorspermidine decarboxylase [Defluviitaleaceae bacterium]